MKVTTTILHEIDADHLNEFVSKTYGGKFDFKLYEQVFENTWSVEVFKEKSENSWGWDQSEINIVKTGMYQPHCTQSVLCALCQDGHIPAGEYLIRV